jgi:hypothetical protein
VAKSVAPSLGVPCDLSYVEAMCHLENVEPAGANVSLETLCPALSSGVSFMGGSWLQRFSDFKSGPFL